MTNDKPTLLNFLIEEGFLPETTTKAVIELEAGKVPVIRAEYLLPEIDGNPTDLENPCGCGKKKHVR